jgi:hypothetical protein
MRCGGKTATQPQRLLAKNLCWACWPLRGRVRSHKNLCLLRREGSFSNISCATDPTGDNRVQQAITVGGSLLAMRSAHSQNLLRAKY